MIASIKRLENICIWKKSAHIFTRSRSNICWWFRRACFPFSSMAKVQTTPNIRVMWNRRGQLITPARKFRKNILVLSRIVFGASFVIGLSFFFLTFDYSRIGPATYSYSVLFHSILTAVIPACIILSRTSVENTTKAENIPITSFEYLVMFSGVGVLLIKMFRISATIQLMYCDYWKEGNHTSCDSGPEEHYLSVSPYLYIAVDTITMVQAILQIPFLIYCQRFDSDSRLYYALIFLLACGNLTRWVFDSFVLIEEISPSSIYYSKDTWIWLNNLINPFALFFRFNSMLLFTEIFFTKSDIRSWFQCCEKCQSGGKEECK